MRVFQHGCDTTLRCTAVRTTKCNILFTKLRPHVYSKNTSMSLFFIFLYLVVAVKRLRSKVELYLEAPTSSDAGCSCTFHRQGTAYSLAGLAGSRVIDCRLRPPMASHLSPVSYKTFRQHATQQHLRRSKADLGLLLTFMFAGSVASTGSIPLHP